MAKKKTLNWEQIRLRYIAGEKPRDIAKDYEGCTGKQIGDRASKLKWKQKKEELRRKDEVKLEDRFAEIRERLVAEYERLAFSRINQVLAVENNTVLAKDTDELDDDALATIAEVSQSKDGGLRIKQHSKQAALDALAKITGLVGKNDDGPEAPPGNISVTLNIKRSDGD